MTSTPGSNIGTLYWPLILIFQLHHCFYVRSCDTCSLFIAITYLRIFDKRTSDSAVDTFQTSPFVSPSPTLPNGLSLSNCDFSNVGPSQQSKSPRLCRKCFRLKQVLSIVKRHISVHITFHFMAHFKTFIHIITWLQKYSLLRQPNSWVRLGCLHDVIRHHLRQWELGWRIDCWHRNAIPKI
jgi:hypothetical protein